MNSITKLPYRLCLLLVLTPTVRSWQSLASSNNLVLTSFCWKGQESIDRSRPLWRWTCLVATSSFHLGSFTISASFLLPYLLSPNPLSPLPNLFCLPQILFSGGEQLFPGPPYAHHKVQFPQGVIQDHLPLNTLCSLTVQILGSTH